MLARAHLISIPIFFIIEWLVLATIFLSLEWHVSCNLVLILFVSMKCKNCDEDLYGPQLYCAKCGQKNISQLNLRYLFSEIIDTVFNLDSKLYRTVKVLILKPGVLSREFIKG